MSKIYSSLLFWQDDEDVLNVAKNNAYNGSEEHSGTEKKIAETWDPNFTVSTWDHSILGISQYMWLCYRRILNRIYTG